MRTLIDFASTPYLGIACFAFLSLFLSVLHYLTCQRLKKAERTVDFWQLATREAARDIETYQNILSRRETERRMFEVVLIHIWGAPALQRTPRDVCKFINDLQETAQRHSETNESLGRAIASQDREIRRLRGNLQWLVGDGATVGEVYGNEAEIRKP